MLQHCSLKVLLSVALFAAGCGMPHRSDIAAPPGGVGTEGYFTVAGERSLGLARAQRFYQTEGVPEAADEMEEARRCYASGNRKVIFDTVFAVAAGFLGSLAWVATDPAYDKRVFFPVEPFYAAAAGAAVGVPLGLLHSRHARTRALPHVQAAARLYNQAQSQAR